MIIKINKKLKSHEIGDEIKLESVNGVPVDYYWAKRLSDSKIDNCITVIKSKKKKGSKKKKWQLQTIQRLI